MDERSVENASWRCVLESWRSVRDEFWRFEGKDANLTRWLISRYCGARRG